MFCQRCGRDNPPNTPFCQGCGQPMAQAQIPVAAPPAYGNYPPQNAYYGQGPTNFAGIGSRFVAALIDGIIISIPIGILSSVLGGLFAARVISRTSRNSYDSSMAAFDIGSFFAGFGLILVLSIVISWAYFAMMESSGWQGTLGKKMMSIKVTDMAGNRITLGRATGRVLVKAFLSGLMLIGYIMAFFTAKKQSLHDLLAGTLVLTNAPSSPMGYAQEYPPQSYPPQQYAPQQYPPQQPYAPQATPCPYCGAGLAPGSRFCTSCGRNL